jgi:GntR family transcriptional repressor for pyruvate dehydrogenase complex
MEMDAGAEAVSLEAMGVETLAREPSLSQRVSEELERWIVENGREEGARLPSERDLASRFGVSRTVIREAVRVLTAKGLLKVQAGSGTLITRPSSQSVSQTLALYLRTRDVALDYAQVHEARRLLEVEIAGRAAERRTAEDLSGMEAILRETAGEIRDAGHFARLDVAFHNALADAARNPLFRILLDSLGDVLYQVRYTAFELPGTVGRALACHRAVFEAVSKADPDAARRAMIEHLREAEETQKETMEFIRSKTASASKP